MNRTFGFDFSWAALFVAVILVLAGALYGQSVSSSVNGGVLGTPPALILSQDQTLV